MSTETSLGDVPNVVSRIQNLRLGHEDGEEAHNGNNPADDESANSAQNAQPIGTLSRARRALNFVWDEEQPTTSTSRGVDISSSNGDKYVFLFPFRSSID